MTRTRRFLGGVTLGYAHLGLVTVVGLWLTPFLLGHIGRHDLGLWLVATQILGYLTLLDFGVVALLPRETAYATGRTRDGGADEVALTVGRFRRVMRWQAPVVAVVAVGLWHALPREWHGLRGPMVGVLATFVVTFPLRAYHAVLQGLQDHAFLGRNQLLAWSAGTVATVGLVLAGRGLDALVAGWVLTQAISAVGCRLRLKRQFPRAWSATPPLVTWPVARELFGRSSWLSIAQLAHVFLNGTDLLMVGKVLGLSAVVPYACTTKLVTVLANHPQLLMQTAAPALSELRASGDRQRLAEICAALARAMLVLSGAVACLVLAVNQLFVSWWVGDAQFAGWPLTLAMTASMLLRHFNDTSVYALYAFRHERAQSLTALADGGVTLAATAVLVHSFGLIGAPLGSLTGCLAVSLPLNLRRLARELGVHWTAPLGNLGGWAVRFALAAAASAALPHVFSGGGAWRIPVVAVLAGLIYAAAMWSLALQPPLGPYVRSMLAATVEWLPGRRVPVPRGEA